jgi:hypothetical protein
MYESFTHKTHEICHRGMAGSVVDGWWSFGTIQMQVMGDSVIGDGDGFSDSR